MNKNPIHVLLGEDNPAEARLIQEMLAEAGGASFTIKCVDRLAEVLEHLSAGKVDLVLLDLSLPDSRGLETFTRTRAHAPQVPIIVLTGFDDEALAMGALREGAQDYLVKGQVDSRLLARAIQYSVERKRVEETLRQRNLELALLNRTSQALNSTLNMDQVLETILEEVRHLLDIVACSVWLVDTETNELVCQQVTGPQNDVVRNFRMPLGVGLVGWVAQTGESLIVPDMHADERYYAAVDERTGLVLNSILSVPLRVKQSVIGVLQVVDEAIDRFDETDLSLLEALAGAAAIAIENASLYQQARNRAEELAALSQASRIITSSLDINQVLKQIVILAGSVANAAFTSAVLVEEDGSISSSASHLREGATVNIEAGSQEVVRRVVTTGQPVVYHELKDDGTHNPELIAAGLRSYIGLPLSVKGKVLGVLFVHSYVPGAFRGLQSLLITFANQAAVAIENAWLFEQVRAGRTQQQALSRRLVEMQEIERGHVARELHDETSQALSSLLLGLSLLEEEADRPDAVVARVTKMEALVDQMLEGLHRLAMNLRPATLDHIGLVETLEQYVETFGQQHNVTARFEVVGFTRERLPSATETAFYRIVQEALTNVARHAQAKNVQVRLQQLGGAVVVVVKDDGVGFEPSGAMQDDHLGLFGIRERAEMLGGTLSIESALGVGTTLLVEVPYP